MTNTCRPSASLFQELGEGWASSSGGRQSVRDDPDPQPCVIPGNRLQACVHGLLYSTIQRPEATLWTILGIYDPLPLSLPSCSPFLLTFKTAVYHPGLNHLNEIHASALGNGCLEQDSPLSPHVFVFSQQTWGFSSALWSMQSASLWSKSWLTQGPATSLQVIGQLTLPWNNYSLAPTKLNRGPFHGWW